MARGQYISIAFMAVALCTSCNHEESKAKLAENAEREPLITVKKYNYETNERVHITVRGLQNCKFKLDPEKFFFQKTFILPNSAIRKPHETSEKKDNSNDLMHFD